MKPFSNFHSLLYCLVAFVSGKCNTTQKELSLKRSHSEPGKAQTVCRARRKRKNCSSSGESEKDGKQGASLIRTCSALPSTVYRDVHSPTPLSKRRRGNVKRQLSAVFDTSKRSNREAKSPACLSIYDAVAKNDLGAVLKFLSDPGIKINARDRRTGKTPLLTAIRYNCTNIVKLLLSHPGVDINGTDHWENTPLMLAAVLGNLRIIEHLLEYPTIKISEQNALGVTALEVATYAGCVSMMVALYCHPTAIVRMEPHPNGQIETTTLFDTMINRLEKTAPSWLETLRGAKKDLRTFTRFPREVLGLVASYEPRLQPANTLLYFLERHFPNPEASQKYLGPQGPEQVATWRKRLQKLTTHNTSVVSNPHCSSY